MDVAFQMRLKELGRRLPHLVFARLRNGSGLQLSKLLRWYFFEYLNRLFRHSPDSFPSSFHVVESFRVFTDDASLVCPKPTVLSAETGRGNR